MAVSIFVAMIIFIGLAFLAKEDPSLKAAYVLLSIAAFLMFALATDGRQLKSDCALIGDEVIYDHEYGEIEGVYYMVNDTLINQDSIEFR